VVVTPPEPTPNRCHPAYTRVCLNEDAIDYDCAGGSGDGPQFVFSTVTMVNPLDDPFDLDRDNDGVGCDRLDVGSGA
jgi:hypothetical protein